MTDGGEALRAGLRWRVDQAAWRLRSIVERPFLGRKGEDAKRLWNDKDSECEYAGDVYASIQIDHASIGRVVEFGTNWGGNLKYLMDRHPELRAVGIDINERVFELTKHYPQYLGIRGDERMLAALPPDAFDLAFTVSVLDHIPSRAVVNEALRHLIRISRYVMLVEPYIDGVDGDVSRRSRNRVKLDLPRGHKSFAPHSYVWNYDEMLNGLDVRWMKTATPRHKSSLGPFYYTYHIRRS